MNKDYITITKSDGSKEQMEAVLIFKLEETKKDYIIYKSKDEHYFAASYDNSFNLNTDFTDREKEKLNKIFENLKNGGGKNA